MSNRIRRFIGCVALALSCIMIGSAITLTTGTANAENVTTVIHTSPFTAAITEVRDSVVGVSNYQQVTYGNYGNGFGSFFFGFGYGYGNGREQEPETREQLASTGSGVVIGEGFVLTNYHVVEKAARLEVTVTDDAGKTTQYAASLVAWDENLDAAIIYAPDCKLPAVTLGDSDKMLVGDWAICIGNPLGFTKTTTVGIVSALNRGIESETYDKYGRKETISNAMIQVDAAINSGNSGGALFNLYGEVVGITNAKYSSNSSGQASIDNIGFAIPMNSVRSIVESIIENGYIAKPYIGITVSTVTEEIMAYGLPAGASVQAVEENSPAAKAGLQTNDIITKVGDTDITTHSELIDIIGSTTPDDVVTLTVYRNGSYITIDVTIGEKITETFAQPAAQQTPKQSENDLFPFGFFNR